MNRKRCPLCKTAGEEVRRQPMIRDKKLVDRIMMQCMHVQARVIWFHYESPNDYSNEPRGRGRKKESTVTPLMDEVFEKQERRIKKSRPKKYKRRFKVNKKKRIERMRRKVQPFDGGQDE